MIVKVTNAAALADNIRGRKTSTYVFNDPEPKVNFDIR